LARVAAIIAVSDHSPVVHSVGVLQGSPDLGVPMVFTDLLGRSAFDRTLEMLKTSPVQQIQLITSRLPQPSLAVPNVMVETVPDEQEIWRRVAESAQQCGEQGFDHVLIIRLGPYVEMGIDRLLENHRERGKGLTRLYDHSGPLDIWIVDSERLCRNRHLTSAKEIFGERASRYSGTSYVNRLETPSDLRRLAVDMLLMRCAARPTGTQVRPGVWVERGATIEKNVRLVGPTYVGRGARLRASVLLTRLSHVESNCEIDVGTAVEDASILSSTYLGPSLDVCHAVVCGNRISHLRKNVDVEISDPSLMRSNRYSSPLLKQRVTATQWMDRLLQTY
jgi:hypothetical protein